MQSRWLRVVLAVALLAIATAWPILEWEGFPHGPVLYTADDAQGIVASDLLALIPFALAIFLIYRLLRNPSRERDL